MGILQSGLLNRAALLAKESLSERMNLAFINMLLGLGIVFSVLILISVIIYLFKFLPNLLNKKDKKQEKSDSSLDQVISQIVEQEEEELELKDDGELVAVITAAIYASMQGAVPADGFIVRSIRKVNNRRRLNA